MRTETAPPALGPAGTTALITELESTVNVAGLESNVRAVAYVKPEPPIDTVFSPAAAPLLGVMTTGAAIPL
jgi:hypothetical protein